MATTGTAWLQQGRHGHNRDGFDKRGGGFGEQGEVYTAGGAVRTKREVQYGQNRTAWTQRDDADNKVRFGQNKVRHGQNRKQIFVLSPAFHYLCGETDAGPAGRIRQNFVRIRI